jgi:hypothetical protein
MQHISTAKDKLSGEVNFIMSQRVLCLAPYTNE